MLVADGGSESWGQVWGLRLSIPKRKFPKIGDPEKVPEIVGSLLFYKDPKIRYPLIFENSPNSFSESLRALGTYPRRSGFDLKSAKEYGPLAPIFLEPEIRCVTSRHSPRGLEGSSAASSPGEQAEPFARTAVVAGTKISSSRFRILGARIWSSGISFL